jgi:type IV pilus assembly protein PilO
MTFSGEYVPVEGDAVTPSYPTAFGITFTPTILGALAAVAGLGLALYLGNQLIGPTYQRFQELKTTVEKKEASLQQKNETIKQIDQLIASVNRTKADNADVRALFSAQEALDTLLLDLNRVILQSNAQLLQFNPDYAASGPVIDGSLGPELNGKLKRQVTAVSFQGTFNQTLKILQTIDRLQTVLVIRDLTAQLQSSTQPGQPQDLITSSFKLYAYVPLTPEEAAAVAQAAAAQAQAAKK